MTSVLVDMRDVRLAAAVRTMVITAREHVEIAPQTRAVLAGD